MATGYEALALCLERRTILVGPDDLDKAFSVSRDVNQWAGKILDVVYPGVGKAASQITEMWLDPLQQEMTKKPPTEGGLSAAAAPAAKATSTSSTVKKTTPTASSTPAKSSAPGSGSPAGGASGGRATGAGKAPVTTPVASATITVPVPADSKPPQARSSVRKVVTYAAVGVGAILLGLGAYHAVK